MSVERVRKRGSMKGTAREIEESEIERETER